MKNNKLQIGLFGFGCVGSGLFRLIEETGDGSIEINKICVKDKFRNRSIPKHYFTFDKTDILNNDEIDIVVELTNDATEALEIIRLSLHAGKPVITAGKKVVSENFELLLQWQKNTGTPLLYEAAVGGSIPIIRTLEDYFGQDQIQHLGGILNGTSNFILTRTLAGNLSYTQALKEAQEKGFAETNPEMDVLGTDPKLKLIILIAHAFGLVLQPNELFHYGITHLNAEDISFARKNNCTVKLVAKAVHQENSVQAYVLPHFVPSGNMLAEVNEEFNAVTLQGKFSDTQFLYGKGAGSHPTATAVMADIAACSREYKYNYTKMNSLQQPLIDKEAEINIYLRYRDEEVLHQLGILETCESYTGPGLKYVIGKVKLNKLIELNPNERNDLFLAAVN